MLLYIMMVASLKTNYQVTTPRRFFPGDPKYIPDLALGGISALIRLGSGALVDGYGISIDTDNESTKGVYSAARGAGLRLTESSVYSKPNNRKRPKVPIELYEFEGCPFCRKVREAVNILDLDVIFYPCPKGGPTFRTKVMKMGGKQQFPYLVDPNTKLSMYESDDIIKYLFQEYGEGTVPSSLKPSFWTTLLCSLASLPRIGKGTKFVEAKKVIKPIVLWAYEASPYCKIVRERLVELELPHLQKTAARGSPKKQQLLDQTGRVQLPYMEDPNTGVKLFESADIIKYINEVYAV